MMRVTGLGIGFTAERRLASLLEMLQYVAFTFVCPQAIEPPRISLVVHTTIDLFIFNVIFISRKF